MAASTSCEPRRCSAYSEDLRWRMVTIHEECVLTSKSSSSSSYVWSRGNKLLFVTRSRLLIVVTSTINRGLKIFGVWWPERVPPGLIHRRALRRFATHAFLGGAILRSASNFLSLRIRTSYRVPYAWSEKLSRTARERVQRLSALARYGLRSTLCPCKKT